MHRNLESEVRMLLRFPDLGASEQLNFAGLRLIEAS